MILSFTRELKNLVSDFALTDVSTPRNTKPVYNFSEAEIKADTSERGAPVAHD
jgi:hypothetical protein